MSADSWARRVYRSKFSHCRWWVFFFLKGAGPRDSLRFLTAHLCRKLRNSAWRHILLSGCVLSWVTPHLWAPPLTIPLCTPSQAILCGRWAVCDSGVSGSRPYGVWIFLRVCEKCVRWPSAHTQQTQKCCVCMCFSSSVSVVAHIGYFRQQSVFPGVYLRRLNDRKCFLTSFCITTHTHHRCVPQTPTWHAWLCLCGAVTHLPTNVCRVEARGRARQRRRADLHNEIPSIAAPQRKTPPLTNSLGTCTRLIKTTQTV